MPHKPAKRRAAWGSLLTIHRIADQCPYCAGLRFRICGVRHLTKLKAIVKTVECKNKKCGQTLKFRYKITMEKVVQPLDMIFANSIDLNPKLGSIKS